jgi:phosphatidylinositol alpha 1,6-mannosyltransferase
VDILFVAEGLLPARGGAERYALELLGALAQRGHRVRALHLETPGPAGAARADLPAGVEAHALPAIPREPRHYWRATRERCAALTAAVAAAPAPDVVVTQLHGAPAALAARAPVVLLVPSYESLCKHAFDAGCQAANRCRTCPRAQALAPAERAGLAEQRAAQDAVLGQARELLAPSEAVARAVRAWSGRDAAVAAPVDGAPQAVGRHGGHVVVAAATWGPHKGPALIPELARLLRGRRVVVTRHGLSPRLRLAARLRGARLSADPLARLYGGAGACVVLSQWPEPFCRIAFEAQACGVPVVAPRTGGLPEHVAPDGLVAPDAGAAAYAERVRALDEPARWGAASTAAREHAQRVLASDPLQRAVAVVERAAG